MPVRNTVTFGAPCWIDLFTSDLARAEDFYGRIFGWAAEPTGPEFNNYVNFAKDGARVGGMMANDGTSGFPDGWTTYLATADAKVTTEAAVAAGGKVFLEPHQVADLGTMAVLADAGGAAVALWQPGTHHGFELIDEAGAPVWHELVARDYAGSIEFYRRVMGWETKAMSDTDEFRYTTLEIDGRPYAGILDGAACLPEGVPAHWQVYIGVDDVDASLAQVVELGGAVGRPAQDTSFGRTAQVADPTGARFSLYQVGTFPS